MGMESYNIMLLAHNVSIVKKHEYWGLSNYSDMSENTIKKAINQLCNCGMKENEYVFRDIIDVKVYCENNYFQGIETRGCISCLEEGIKRFYELYYKMNEIIPIHVYVLDQRIDIHNENELYDTICNLYSDKINLFKRQYGDEELIVSSGGFYNEINKRKKWYYKIFHK